MLHRFFIDTCFIQEDAPGKPRIPEKPGCPFLRAAQPELTPVSTGRSGAFTCHGHPFESMKARGHCPKALFKHKASFIRYLTALVGCVCLLSTGFGIEGTTDQGKDSLLLYKY